MEEESRRRREGSRRRRARWEEVTGGLSEKGDAPSFWVNRRPNNKTPPPQSSLSICPFVYLICLLPGAETIFWMRPSRGVASRSEWRIILRRDVHPPHSCPSIRMSLAGGVGPTTTYGNNHLLLPESRSSSCLEFFDSRRPKNLPESDVSQSRRRLIPLSGRPLC